MSSGHRQDQIAAEQGSQAAQGPQAAQGSQAAQSPQAAQAASVVSPSAVSPEEAVADAKRGWSKAKRKRKAARAREKSERAQKRKKPAPSYSSRVTWAFALTAAMTAVIMASIIAIVWSGQFQQYTYENLTREANATAVAISRRYAEAGSFTQEVLSQAASASRATSGIATQVLDANGEIVYSNAEEVAANMGIENYSAPKNFKNVEVVESPITVDGVEVGKVRVWAVATNTFLTEYDAEFRLDSYKAMFIAAVIAIAIASLIGFVYAKGLVTPMRRVTATALKVKEGDLSARTGLTGEDEISQLGQTFDSMVASVEKDRQLERRLTTDVAHELRTPLMAIQATVEGMMDGVLPADERRLATLNSETTRLSRLVSALLELSRLESGADRIKFSKINLSQLLGQLVESQQALFDVSDVALTYACDPNVVIEGNADKIRQATLNLISNAVRYTDEGGHVHVEVRLTADEEVCVSVADDGIGIAEVDLKRVFSRFWRADEARNRESGGLGVGLSVVREIVNRHHGHVDVASTLGHGTTFYMYFPVSQPEIDEKGRIKPKQQQRAKPSHSKQTVKAKQRERAKLEATVAADKARIEAQIRRREQEAAQAQEKAAQAKAKAAQAQAKEQEKAAAVRAKERERERKAMRSQTISRSKEIDRAMRENRARRLEQARQERERRERQERERQEREKQERERLERERLERQRQERERQERERLERQRQEREQQERQRREREAREMQARERQMRERQARERYEREHQRRRKRLRASDLGKPQGSQGAARRRPSQPKQGSQGSQGAAQRQIPRSADDRKGDDSE